MKKINTKIGLFLAATAAFVIVNSTAVFSQSKNVQISLYKSGTTIAEIKVDGLKTETPALITIKKENGTTLFSEESKAEKYVKMIDFGSVSDGVYVVDIVQPKGVVRKIVQKEDKTLSIMNESYVFNNYVRFAEEGKLLVKFNNQIKEPVTLRIIDEKGNILHEESDIKAESYTALFNLSRLHKGSYNMSLTSSAFSNTQKIQL